MEKQIMEIENKYSHLKNIEGNESYEQKNKIFQEQYSKEEGRTIKKGNRNQIFVDQNQQDKLIDTPKNQFDDSNIKQENKMISSQNNNLNGCDNKISNSKQTEINIFQDKRRSFADQQKNDQNGVEVIQCDIKNVQQENIHWNEEPLLGDNINNKKKRRTNGCFQSIIRCMSQCCVAFKKCLCINKKQLLSIEDNLAQYQINQRYKQIQYEQQRMFEQQTQKYFYQIISDSLNYQYENYDQQEENLSREEEEIKIDSNLQNEIDYSELNFVKIKKRIWSIEKFYLDQKIQLSKNFKDNEELIFFETNKSNHFICRYFMSQDNVDLFAGYYQNSQGVEQNNFYKIYYSPASKNLDEEISIIEQYEKNQSDLNQKIHIKVSENIQILVMLKKTFLILQNKYKKFQIAPVKFWNKEFFDEINKEKPFLPNNQKICQQCKYCVNNKDCAQYKNLRKFYNNQDLILERMKEKDFYICEYLNQGGEGIIFEGFRQIRQEPNQFMQEDFIFKILFGVDEQQMEEEVKIMKLFEQNINTIQFVDHCKLNDLNIDILILEKCKHSLADQLEKYKLQKNFQLSRLFSIIFDLIDGLIQLRYYNILHLDIKPANILLSYSNNYVYTDFGISSIKQQNKFIQVKGYTRLYAPPEQLELNQNVDFKADVFSLGVTLNQVVDIYEQCSTTNTNELIKSIKEIIKNDMIQKQQKERQNCIEIHEKILLAFINSKSIEKTLEKYSIKIRRILELSPYNKNKDIHYVLFANIYYNQKLLYLLNMKYQNTRGSKMIMTLPYLISDSNECKFVLNKYNKDYLLTKEFEDIVCEIFELSQKYLALGEYHKSLEYSLLSYEMTKQIIQSPNLLTFQSLNIVGQCFLGLSEYEKALEYSLKSLQMSKQIFKQNHPDTGSTLNSIGCCYLELGNYKKAIENFLESLKISKVFYNEDSLEIASLKQNIGTCYLRMEDYQNASKYLQISQGMQNEMLNQNHPLEVTIQNNIGTLKALQGDYLNALKIQLESLEKVKQIYKKDHKNMALFLMNLGTYYKNIGDDQIALQYFLESNQMLRQIIEENDQAMLESYYNKMINQLLIYLIVQGNAI